MNRRAEQGAVMLLALFTLLMASIVVALVGALSFHQIQDLKSERSNVELVALRDAALAHGLGLARSGGVAGGEQIDFRFEFGGGELSGSVWETSGRRDRPGRGVYRIEGFASLQGRRRSGRLTLNTFRFPAELSGLQPAAEWRQ